MLEQYITQHGVLREKNGYRGLLRRIEAYVSYHGILGRRVRD